jgi:hypothetical protein
MFVHRVSKNNKIVYVKNVKACDATYKIVFIINMQKSGKTHTLYMGIELMIYIVGA